MRAQRIRESHVVRVRRRANRVVGQAELVERAGDGVVERGVAERGLGLHSRHGIVPRKRVRERGVGKGAVRVRRRRHQSTGPQRSGAQDAGSAQGGSQEAAGRAALSQRESGREVLVAQLGAHGVGQVGHQVRLVRVGVAQAVVLLRDRLVRHVVARRHVAAQGRLEVAVVLRQVGGRVDRRGRVRHRDRRYGRTALAQSVATRARR